MLLVIPATVPAFASGDATGTGGDPGATVAVSTPAEPAAEPAPEPASNAPKPEKYAATPSPHATILGGDTPPADRTSEDPADTTGATDSTGATDPSGTTDSTGATGATGPSGPAADGGAGDASGPGADGRPADSGTTATPTTGEGTPPSGTTESGPAPRSTGTLTDAGGRTSEAGTEQAGNGGASTQAIIDTLRNGVSSGQPGADADTRGVANRATDQIQRNAESGIVGALVVTRIINEIPAWVFWALGALAIIALAGLGLYLRERLRRRSAEQEAMADELTGISNRKAFDRRLDLEWRRAARYGRSLGLMVMDLDGFKQVNDLNGHAAGDRVLRDVAQALDRRMRDTDLVARIGGDEFAVICPETGINELMTVRRQLGEQITSELEGTVGLSIGVAEFVPSDDDASSILARADESMYRVKRGEATALPA